MTTTSGTVRELLDTVGSDDSDGGRARLRPIATGFEPLDAVLGGGLRAEDVTLLGGRPGTGKTIAALQAARQAAIGGTQTVYACYEHTPATLLGRLLTLELGSLARPDEVPTLEKLRRIADEIAYGGRPIGDLIAEPLGEEAYLRLTAYADRLRLVRASGATTGLAQLTELAAAAGAGALIVVDYLQKIPVPGVTEERQVLAAIEGLKELAMGKSVAILALAAADDVGPHRAQAAVPPPPGVERRAHECEWRSSERQAPVRSKGLLGSPGRAESSADGLSRWKNGSAVVASVQNLDLGSRGGSPSLRVLPEGAGF